MLALEVVRVLRCLPRLPVDDLIPVAVEEHSVDLADDDLAGEREVDLALNVDRAHPGPRRALEDALEPLEVVAVGLGRVLVELEDGGIDDVGVASRPVALLDPVVEEGAEPCGAERPFGHRAAEARGDPGGVGHEVLEPRSGDAPGRSDVLVRIESPSPLLEKQGEVVRPGALGTGERIPNQLGRLLDHSAAVAEGVHRPGERLRVVAERVRLERAVLRDRSDDAVGAEGPQELTRHPRLDLRRPERSAEKQGVPGAGDGDIGEPALLELVAFAHGHREGTALGDELLPRRRPLPVKDGKLGAVAPELVGQRAVGEPSAVSLVGRGGQLTVDEARHDHEIVLEPLRTVDGHELHGSRLRFLRAGSERVAPLRLAEPAEKPGEGGGFVDGEIAGEGVEEGVHRRTAEGPRPVRHDLDVQQEFLLDEGHEVEQVEARAGAQACERGSRVAEALEADLAEGPERPVRGSRRRDEIEGVDDRPGLAVGDRAAHECAKLLVEGLLGVVAGREPGRHAPERLEVAHPDAPVGAGEEAHEFGARRRITDHRQRADEVGDLRLVEQPPDAEHVERDPVRAQRVDEHRLGLAGTEQHRRARRRDARSSGDELLPQPPGGGVGLLGEGLVERHVDGQIGGEG